MLALILSLILLPLQTPLKPETRADVTYSLAGGETLQMDLVYPSKPAAKPAPAVVLIHGGAWIGGNRKDMAPLAQAMADQGFVVASPSYRLAPKHRWPAQVDDVQTAVRFLRHHARELNIDPKRIGASGASAGGHLALMLGTTDTLSAATEYKDQSSRVSAVFNIFGPTDMSQDFDASYDFLYQMLLGKARKDAAKEIAQASPVTHLNQNSAPVFTLHGTADQVVPARQASRLQERMKALGLRNETVLIEGMGHEVKVENPEVRAALERGIAFLKAELTK